MSKVVEIAEGFFNNLMNINEDLYEERIKICRSCKLHKVDNLLGEICNHKLYIDPETNNISNVPKRGYIKGCGCVLASKTRVDSKSCDAGK